MQQPLGVLRADVRRERVAHPAQPVGERAVAVEGDPVAARSARTAVVPLFAVERRRTCPRPTTPASGRTAMSIGFRGAAVLPDERRDLRIAAIAASLLACAACGSRASAITGQSSSCRSSPRPCGSGAARPSSWPVSRSAADGGRRDQSTARGIRR